MLPAQTLKKNFLRVLYLKENSIINLTLERNLARYFLQNDLLFIKTISCKKTIRKSSDPISFAISCSIVLTRDFSACRGTVEIQEKMLQYFPILYRPPIFLFLNIHNRNMTKDSWPNSASDINQISVN